MEATELELRAIAAGDDAAFGLWMARTEGSLRASLARFAAAVDTEAVLQETLLRIWQVAPHAKPDGKPEPLLRLALRIARNHALDELRCQRRLTPTEEEELRLAADELAQARQPSASDPFLRKVIVTCRELLPPQPRRAFDARQESGGGASDATLAEQLGMRRNTFLQNITRARRLLQQCLRSHRVELDGEGA